MIKNITKIIFLLLLILNVSSAKHFRLEKEYQKIFCEKVRGKMEYVLSDRTRVDCQTSTYSFEVDFGRKAFEAVGQSLYYSMMTGKKAGIVLIQETKADNKYIGRILKLAEKYNIHVFIINKNLEIRKIKSKKSSSRTR